MAGDMADLTSSDFFYDLDLTATEDAPQRDDRRRRMGLWLDAVGTMGWRRACEAASVTEQQIVRWLRLYPEFRAAHETISREIADRLERVLDEIAAGEREATPTQVTALQFRLRGLRPDLYRDRASVQIDATTRAAGDGDGGRARSMLAEWSVTQLSTKACGRDVDNDGVDTMGTDCGQVPGRA